MQINRQRLLWSPAGERWSKWICCPCSWGWLKPSNFSGKEASVPRALWGCDGYLEISVANASAASLLDATIGLRVIAHGEPRRAETAVTKAYSIKKSGEMNFYAEEAFGEGNISIINYAVRAFRDD